MKRMFSEKEIRELIKSVSPSGSDSEIIVPINHLEPIVIDSETTAKVFEKPYKVIFTVPGFEDAYLNTITTRKTTEEDKTYIQFLCSGGAIDGHLPIDFTIVLICNDGTVTMVPVQPA